MNCTAGLIVSYRRTKNRVLLSGRNPTVADARSWAHIIQDLGGRLCSLFSFIGGNHLRTLGRINCPPQVDATSLRAVNTSAKRFESLTLTFGNILSLAHILMNESATTERAFIVHKVLQKASDLIRIALGSERTAL